MTAPRLKMGERALLDGRLPVVLVRRYTVDGTWWVREESGLEHHGILEGQLTKIPGEAITGGVAGVTKPLADQAPKAGPDGSLIRIATAYENRTHGFGMVCGVYGIKDAGRLLLAFAEGSIAPDDARMYYGEVRVPGNQDLTWRSAALFGKVIMSERVWCENPAHPREAHLERGPGPYGDDWQPGESCRYPHNADVPEGRLPSLGHPYTSRD